MIRRGRPRDNISLPQKQEELLALYDDGTLLAEANSPARISGNDHLRRSDGGFIDIGGSTGGYTRTVLYDWGPPDLTEFEPDDPGDVSQLADGWATPQHGGLATVAAQSPSVTCERGRRGPVLATATRRPYTK